VRIIASRQSAFVDAANRISPAIKNSERMSIGK
jgi:hypothetical protein